MTTITAGSPYTALSSWASSPGGAAVDVSGLTVAITQLSDLTVIVAATSTGIVHMATGLYAYVWTPDDDATGDYLIVWTTGADQQASEIVSIGEPTGITLDDVIDYIGVSSLAPWAVTVDDVVTYPQVADALTAETKAQLMKVTYPAATDDDPNPDVSDLQQALKRRVQRNLAMRPLPLAFQTSGFDSSVIRIGSNDPEIRRLEAPYRRRVVA